MWREEGNRGQRRGNNGRGRKVRARVKMGRTGEKRIGRKKGKPGKREE